MQKNSILLQEITVEELQQLIGFSIKNRIYELKKDCSHTLLQTSELLECLTLLKK